MGYETHKEVLCRDTGKTFRTGDVVTIKGTDGGGYGGCKIVKITDTGFHFTQGSSRTKTIQYKDIREIG